MKDRRSRAKKALIRRRKELDAAKHDWLRAAEQSGNDILHCTGEPLSLRASDNADQVTATFEAVAYSGGVMTPNLAIPWKGQVVVDLSGMQMPTSSIPVHRDHDATRPVAHTTALDNDRTRLACTGVFSVDSEDTRNVITGAQKGFPWRPSVGLKMLATKTIAQGQRIIANGREFIGPLLLVTHSILKEISLVTIPGDAEAYATIAASQGSEDMNFNEWLVAHGHDPVKLTADETVTLQAKYNAEQLPPANTEPTPVPAPAPAAPPAAPSPTDLTARFDPDLIASTVRQTIATEHARSTEIRNLCATFANPQVVIGGKTVDLCAHAIANNFSIDQTELHARRHTDVEATRNARPSGIAIHSHHRAEQNSLQALQAGMLLRAECPLDHPAFANPRIRHRLPSWLQANVNDPNRQRIMDSGHAHADTSLVDVCRMALQASGADVPSNRNDMLQASFSTGATSAFFGATIGAKVLMHYAEIKDFSIGWCQESDNPDLEPHNRNQVEAAQNLAYHPVGGEAAHTGLSVTTEKAQVHRFTRQMEIDEADFMSDNFGKFKETPRMFGLAAGRVRPNLVAAVLLANPTLLKTARALFNTTDGNSTASAALARATLSAAIARMARRMDGDASINLSTTHLLVPPELYDLAIQLTKSVNLSNDSGSGEKNPLAQYNITPVMEPRLANGLVHPISGSNLAGSVVTWYTVSSEGNTIEVTYLDGAGRVPVVRTTNLTNGKFGFNVDVRHYVGASAMDWRPFDRNVG